ncbi:MAG: hypothetical protein MOGMAGMI_00417 [Candidatus Omnitrophica bacterium]|nr:hypothetical protein [Candidatus Omnitrophota bacterium]
MRITVPERWTDPVRLAALAAAVSAAVLSLSSAPQRILYTYAWDYAEPVAALSVLELGLRPLIYQDFQVVPYRVYAYNPFYVYLAAALRPLWESVWACGRALSAVGAFAAAVSLYTIARSWGARRTLAFTVGAGWIAMPLVFRYLCSMRPDLTALGLTAAGLAVAMSTAGSEPQKRRYLLAAVSGLCFAAAFLSRQNFVLAPAAVFLARLTERGRRGEGWWTVLACALAVLPVMAFFESATSGAYLRNIVVFNLQPYYPQLVLRNLAGHLPLHWPMYAAALIVLPQALRENRSRPLALYALLALGEIVTAGRIGSDENYFLEPLLGAYLMVIWALCRAGRPVRSIALGVVAAILLCLVPYHVQARQGTLEAITSTERDLEPVRQFLRTVPGPVLSEDMGLLISAGLPVSYQFFEATQLADRGLFDDRPFLERIRRGDFPVVVVSTDLLHVTRSQRFRPEFVRALQEAYRLKGRHVGMLWFEPKSAAS